MRARTRGLDEPIRLTQCKRDYLAGLAAAREAKRNSAGLSKEALAAVVEKALQARGVVRLQKPGTAALASLATRKDKALRQAGGVYFIADRTMGAVKIGHAKNAGKRLIGLQIGTPSQLQLLACTRGGRAEELALHQRFAHLRIRGEWFRLDGELAAFIVELSERSEP